MLKVVGQPEAVEEVFKPTLHGFQKRFKQVWVLQWDPYPRPAALPIKRDSRSRGWSSCHSARGLFGIVKRPLQRLSDLELGDQKVTSGHRPKPKRMMCQSHHLSGVLDVSFGEGNPFFFGPNKKPGSCHETGITGMPFLSEIPSWKLTCLQMLPKMMIHFPVCAGLSRAQQYNKFIQVFAFQMMFFNRWFFCSWCSEITGHKSIVELHRPKSPLHVFGSGDV